MEPLAISQAKDSIQHATHILLHCHPSPDGDSVGSALAMYWALKRMGKEVEVIAGDSVKPKTLARLPGFTYIKEQTWGQTDKSKYDLFISLDSSSFNQITKLEEVHFPDTLKVIVVDHHPTNTRYGHVNLVEETAPATAQLLFELFEQWAIEITPEIAITLFVGIYTDTGGLKYPLTTGRTYEIAGKLVEKYPDFTNVLFDLENSNEQETLVFLGLGLTNMELFLDGKLAISSVGFEDLQKNHILPEHTTNNELSNLMKSVPGHIIGVSMIETEPSFVKVSLRTRDETIFDVSQIAAKLGGGGHKAAAGVSMKMSLEEAKRELVRVVEEIFSC